MTALGKSVTQMHDEPELLTIQIRCFRICSGKLGRRGEKSAELIDQYQVALTQDGDEDMSNTIYDIAVDRIDGSKTTLNDFRGEVLLVVNVASKCGLTPQYEGLEKLQKTYHGKKFSVLGFPANDFAGQEPGSNEEIQGFCSTTYGVDFPLFSKIPVTGPNKHPLYKHLTTEQPATEDREGMEKMLQGYKIETTAKPEVVWNFEKFLINRQGKIVRRFSPDTAPDSPKLVEAIEAELAKA